MLRCGVVARCGERVVWWAGRGWYRAGEFSLQGAEVQQTAITWEDIAAMNSRPASSWDTMTNASIANGVQAGPAPTGEASAMDVDASTATATAQAATGAGAGEEEEPSNFHAEFMRQMRAQTAEVARQAAHASAEVLERGDDALDALVEEFPDAAEHNMVGGASDEDDDDAAAASALLARSKRKELPKVDHSQIDYAPFRKALYIEVPEIKAMSDEQVRASVSALIMSRPGC